ncbi:ABC1 kinase family protein [Inhella proteolytica]|uniref:Ubiquinone biosynthesis protein UbiB n=1 Tax=Inhella proteolytica TaxID=2795029 RepID=A0A931NK17_9BURK|nr:AarF/UbiB family protein [Inhella proteolytica]MBH9579230.1 ubiquinone biosynthesis protein UbiB [Inhella proteolytica]
MLIEAVGGMQDIGRMHDIASVLVRHGLGDMVRRFGLADALARAGRALHIPQADALARLEPPAQTRRALEELGPTFVKLGQILAGRADLLGPEWIAELSKLHSRVPPVPLEALRPQLREDLGGEPETVFAEFDPEPLAAASIAQVHRARLQDGRAVVVKIRRPNIHEVVEADLRLLARFAASAERDWPALQPYRPVQLVREFARSLRRELDLANECRQAERIARNLAALPEVQIPAVHWAFTHERVNVQDFIEGVPGEDLQRVDRAGLDRKLLAQRGARVVLKMIVEDGLFHADPHPGNVFYLPGNRIALIDFGMVGRLPLKRREQLLQLLLGLVERRPQEVADVLLEWAGDRRAGLNLEQLEDEIEAFVDQYHGVPLAQLHLGQMLAEVTQVLREHHLALPPDLALLIKAFISMEGMGRALDPDFHMTAEALPLLRQVMTARYQPKAIAQRGWSLLTRTLKVAQGLPEDLSRLLRRARHGQLRVGVDIAHIRQVGDQLERASSRLSLALVIAALIIGSSIVMTVGGGPTLFGLPAFGLLGFLAAVVGGLALLRSIWRGFRGRGLDEE